ncbi:MAG: preprotein translocase subunit SecA [Gammaproteobacteria bacterium]|jgi:preprotein translocase subunit SecA
MGFTQFFKKLFAIPHEREIKRLRLVVDKINALEEKVSTYSEDAMRAQTEHLRARLNQGETLEAILPEAFALVREAAKRTLNMRHFDVQLMGGMVLHEGKIAEMHTGEGKTLVATLPAYLNALTGKGVHVVTVNPYLAARDAKWMAPIYEYLGLTVGTAIPGMTLEGKQKAYAADITYATNNELGFDYLRDNMAFSLADKVQRELNFVIVDEVDSVLIDEARTPLIISGKIQDSTALYGKINEIAPRLKAQTDEKDPGDYTIDEKSKQVHLTEQGQSHVEELLHETGLLQDGDNLYNPGHLMLLHHIHAALRAHTLFQRDVHYMIQDNEVVIIDEHTGRAMPGRRWSEGLHQAIEAKEGLEIQNESQTLASITFQNYFRQYEKLAGMTGTAATEAQEFRLIYNLLVVPIPTHNKNIRIDAPDLIFASTADKFKAIVADIEKRHAKKQPVLLGTTSIENSEILSKLLDKAKIPHQVLNAKHHEKEAQIIAQAGAPGAVTIATNMAGRGTDIVLGGDIVINAGGLHVIGSERHEARRIDNQLRGRCGRQGDPGSTQFYLSLEDNLMRIFASDRMKMIMNKLGLQGDQAIESPMVSRAIENAQRKVEAHNFDIRKQLLEFDDVANDQRRVIYAKRRELMKLDDITDSIEDMRYDVYMQLVLKYLPLDSIKEQWDVEGLTQELKNEFALDLPIQNWVEEETILSPENLAMRVIEAVKTHYDEKLVGVDNAVARRFEKSLILQILDSHWKDHLAAMDYLRRSVSLRGYANKDPKQEYKREAFLLFSAMLDASAYEACQALAKFKVSNATDMDAIEASQREQAVKDIKLEHPAAASSQEDEVQALTPKPIVRGKKIGRNDPCHCGSGKKYKNCHGKI